MYSIFRPFHTKCDIQNFEWKQLTLMQLFTTFAVNIVLCGEDFLFHLVMKAHRPKRSE